MATTNSVTPVAAVRVLLTLSFLLLMVGNSIAKSRDYEEIVRPGSNPKIFYAHRSPPPLTFSKALAKFQDIPNVEGNRRMLYQTTTYRVSPPTKYPPPKAPPAIMNPTP